MRTKWPSRGHVLAPKWPARVHETSKRARGAKHTEKERGVGKERVFLSLKRLDGSTA
jgi:hypothetical protein